MLSEMCVPALKSGGDACYPKDLIGTHFMGKSFYRSCPFDCDREEREREAKAREWAQKRPWDPDSEGENMGIVKYTDSSERKGKERAK